jgi:hypothetical protein
MGDNLGCGGVRESTTKTHAIDYMRSPTTSEIGDHERTRGHLLEGQWLQWLRDCRFDKIIPTLFRRVTARRSHRKKSAQIILCGEVWKVTHDVARFEI